MSTITSLRPRGRSKDRFVLELDGRPFATVDAVVWISHALHVGDELSGELRAQLLDASLRLAARDRATRMLAARARPREELRRRLVQKGIRPEHAACAVEALARAGLLDDAGYADAFARSRALAGHGRRRILADLARAGVGRDLAAGAVERVFADASVDADEALRRLAERRLKSLARCDPPTRLRRLAAFLARRGHSPGLATRLVQGERR